MAGMGGGGGFLQQGIEDTPTLAQGIFENLKGQSLLKKSKSMMTPLEDPEQRSMLSEISRKRKQLEAGMDVSTQMGKDIIGSNLAGTQQAMTSLSGGNVGAAMAGLAMAQRGAGVATNELMSNSAQRGQTMLALQESLLANMAQRRMMVQEKRYEEARQQGLKLMGSGTDKLNQVSANAASQFDIMGSMPSIDSKGVTGGTGGGASSAGQIPQSDITKNASNMNIL